MEKILAEINLGKTKFNNSAKCVQIRKTSTSNIENGFAIAEFLQNKGFVISGRAIIQGNIQGLHVDASENCIKLIIGSL